MEIGDALSGYEIATEVFAIPYLAHHIVYAPLLQTSLLVNDATVNLLADLQDHKPVRPTAGDTETFALLVDLGIVKQAEKTGPTSGESETIATHARQGDFKPTGCTLFLTTECNLRCRYCYARGGDNPRRLAEDVARSAIDLVIDNAAELNAPEVLLAFHGGGEPTRAAETLKACVGYARVRCEKAGLDLNTAVATNGVMNDAMRDWMAHNIKSVMVSLDGVPRVHNELRPRPSGRPSFAAVERTLKRLAQGDCIVGVRITCTKESVEDLVSSVIFLLENLRLHTIHLEPLFVCGRSLESGLEPPAAERFVELFRRCRDLAACEDVELVYSGARHSTIAPSFCQVSEPSFSVTVDGDVTACYEVTDRQDPRADTFIYGAFDTASGKFVFEPERIDGLAHLTVANAPRCAKCFCKYHCAGDCPSKRLYPGSQEAVARRCAINRRLTQDQLELSLLGASDAVPLMVRQHGGTQHAFVFRGGEG